MSGATNKPWFIRRSGLMRYHIGPYAWQGWVISGVFVAAIGLTMGVLRRYLLAHLSLASAMIISVAIMLILLGAFVAIAVRFSVSEKSLNDRDRGHSDETRR